MSEKNSKEHCFYLIVVSFNKKMLFGKLDATSIKNKGIPQHDTSTALAFSCYF